MTLEEMLARESIRLAMARYTMAGDRLDTDAFAAVFTAEGILETEGVAEQDAFRHVGRDEIHAWMARWRERAVAGGEGVHRASFVRHHLSTSLVELVDPGLARARTYWTAYTDIGADHGGHYLDVLRRVDATWLIAHRRVRLDWRSPGSRMFTAVARTRE